MWGFRNPTPAAGTYKWKEVTTLESAVGEGIGRSIVIITTPEKSEIVDKYALENIFSTTGINIQNVQTNEKTIFKIIS
jgi:hypothetical protein